MACAGPSRSTPRCATTIPRSSRTLARSAGSSWGTTRATRACSSPEEWEKAVRLFHERVVKIEELTYRAHGFFTGRELYFLDPSGNLLEVRDPTWTAGMPTPSLADILGDGTTSA